MSTRLRLDDVRLAWESRDLDLSQLVVGLAGQPDEVSTTPPRQGARTFANFLAELRNPAFHAGRPRSRRISGSSR